GGQRMYNRKLTKALVDLGHAVEVFAGQPYPILDERIELHELPSLDLWNDHFPGRFPGYWELKTKADWAEAFSHLSGTFGEPLAFSMRALKALKSRQGDFDLVHDNQCLGYSILGIEKLIPTIVTLHHPITRDRALEMAHTTTWRKRYSIGRWYNFVKMQGRVASRMPRIVVVSENSIKDIHSDMGVSLDRMRLVPVGVDPDLFTSLPHVSRRPGRLITTASADVALKGLSYLLEAMAKLRTERDVTLTIIGKPRDGASNDLIDRLGLRPHIEFVSGVPDERIVELYAEAEIAVVPSLYEGFSLPAIEAMACGVPLVTTTGGALPEVVGPSGDTAMTVPTGDAGALAHQLVDTLNDPEQRARLGEGGRRRVLDRFTWRKTAEGSAEHYYLELEAHARRRFDAGERT